MNQIIPHKCGKCGAQTMWFSPYERNYTYNKGVYFHTDCYNKLIEEKKEKRKIPVLKKGGMS